MAGVCGGVWFEKSQFPRDVGYGTCGKARLGPAIHLTRTLSHVPHFVKENRESPKTAQNLVSPE